MKKRIALFLVSVLCFCMLCGCNEETNAPAEETTSPLTFHIASLKGPTTIGIAKLMSDAEKKTAANEYQVTMYGTADEIVPQMVNGEIDAALVPCNLASVLYAKTKGAVQVAAVNTLGVLYIVETGDAVQSVADLAGKTIYSTGKGTTPEYVLKHILKENGLDPEKDLTIEYKSESTEVAALLAQGENVVAVLPEPYVAAVRAQNPAVRVALSMTEEWDKISGESRMVTGVLLVRKEFAEQNSVAFQAFLNEYKASTEFANANIEETAVLAEKYGIVEKAAIAEKAIPACNIVFMEGAEMKAAISGYLEVLYLADPKSVGGELPDDGFYYER